ncbi:MAG: recombination protein RecR [Armatimonadia bacterium]|nr:recombination protein RecR [Armatimonadia bacterium]
MYPRAVTRLIEAFRKIPGVGPKSAQRYAVHVLRASSEDAKELAEAILDVKESIRPCERCGNYTDTELCSVCADPRREPRALCVVSYVRDLMAIERAGEFKGRYHVLGGVLSPADGVGPEELTISALIERVRDENVSEVILATSPSVEGDATALYLARLLGSVPDLDVTRLASGLPAGADLDYADQTTIAAALSGRRKVD